MGSHAQGGLHGVAVRHHRCKSSTQNKCLAQGRCRGALPKQLGACVQSAHICIFPGLFQSLGWPFQPAGMGSQERDAGESGRDETTGRTRGEPRWHVAPRGQAPPRKLDSGSTRLERTGMFLSPAKASSRTSLRQPWVTEGLLERTAQAGRAGGTQAGAAEGEHT